MAATRVAIDRARTGGGPTFIEAVTFRMGPHTTSDDPTRYVDPLLREEWAGKDPLARVEAHLRAAGVLDEAAAASIQQKADEVAAQFRAGCLGLPEPGPLDLFDHVYATPHATLDRQRSQYRSYLDGFALDGFAPGGTEGGAA
jgi:pyruvate dehydrogenase E1 component alpha subunit